ncbi:metal ABC transporter ATPase [Pseudomonas typographi]|uniref:Metal ABC transporter ATPase n=1 Tax=Pseudomonas typographi TaxID=2715964 RepID=A0ABR7YVR0_9PSED|nr:metal ABC transporter ATPase [Pseudomonas typographi]MBD1549857.1 metal ABC transporter ATPase [Pseudomonas typographi]MBD1585238.1 metal ABC transporter ATPase [Pseudomonas typographi]MBD1597285.1 metal ABC transporter ATPase [Pseudomonas typographi]
MPRTLSRKNPGNFKTLPLFVEATPEALTYQSIGMPINFSQTLERRQQIDVDDPEHFSVELANLGVSVRLTLAWQGNDYWVLVRQRREDRGDVVLKLISGYVPAHELNLPLHTAVQEVAEECLLQTPEGWLNGRFKDTWLPTPYAQTLRYRESPAFDLSPRAGAARTVRCGGLTLIEKPRAYVHLPTASLQVVYDLRLEVPREARVLSLYHVDERLEKDQLVTRLNPNRPDLYLVPLKDGKPVPELYTLKKGELHPAPTRGLYLAESFAAQDGWVVREERIKWRDWLHRQGLAVQSPQKSGLKKITHRARALIRLARHKM